VATYTDIKGRIIACKPLLAVSVYLAVQLCFICMPTASYVAVLGGHPAGPLHCTTLQLLQLTVICFSSRPHLRCNPCCCCC
jgi:hypothetical protein